MQAFVLKKPGEASIETVPDPLLPSGNVMLRVRMAGFCGSDLNSFRGLNSLVSYPRILGHEISATVLENTATTAGSLRGGGGSVSILQLGNADPVSVLEEMPASLMNLWVCNATAGESPA